MQERSQKYPPPPSPTHPPSCFALLILAAPPFHFIKSKDGHGSLRSRLSSLPPPTSSPFYVLNLSPDLQPPFSIPLPRKSSISISPAPFVWRDSRVIAGRARSGMRRGLVLVGGVLACPPTATDSPSSLFVGAPIVIGELEGSATHVAWLEERLRPL